MTASAFQNIPISNITVPEDRLRVLDEAFVGIIAASVEEIGRLLQPIIVKEINGEFVLVVGLFRLAAFKKLGRATIPGFVREYDSPEQERLEEITENVVRRELNALDRARSLFEMDRVYKKLYPGLEKGGDKQSVEAKEKLSAILALRSQILKKCDLSKRSFYRAIAIWKSLSVDSRTRIPGTWLADHQAQLSSLAALEKSDQAKVLDLLLVDEPEFETVVEALDHLAGKNKPSATDILYRSAIGNLGRMTPTLRTTVFDTFKDEIISHATKRGWI